MNKSKVFLIGLCLLSMILGALLSQFILNPQVAQASGQTIYKCLTFGDEPDFEAVLNSMSKDGWVFIQGNTMVSHVVLIFKKG